jgi:hypothetical protein
LSNCLDTVLLIIFPSRTIFNWKTNAIGIKSQRIDYHDQLRQPQAEISFEELISFLLDLGAVPDETGFRMLRASGLWVPVGTPLLLSPDRQEPVLTIAPLDDSDGNLSLAVRWSSTWGMRDHTHLPPYWVLINGLPPTRPASKPDRQADEHSDEKPLISETTEDKKSSAGAKYMPVLEDSPPAIRCQVGVNGLMTAVPDDFDSQMFESLNISHLGVDDAGANTVGVWFACAITALGTSSSTILWNYKIPANILAFARKSTIPCGILVFLDLVAESETPGWATTYPHDEAAEREAQFRKMREDSQAIMKENMMPPDQKAIAVKERQARQHQNWVDSLNGKRRLESQRAETRMNEAMTSPKWENRLVAKHNLIWLKKEGLVDESHELKRATEVLLWKMINDGSFASALANTLDEWQAFEDNGGMRKADYLNLKEKKAMFAYASLVLALLEDSISAAHGSLATDLQECLRVWKKVRLG